MAKCGYIHAKYMHVVVASFIAFHTPVPEHLRAKCVRQS